MDRESLKDFLVYEAEYSRERVESMGDFELLDKWLNWYGIVGFSYDIVDIVTNLKLE